MPSAVASLRSVGPWPAALKHVATPQVLAASNDFAEVRDRLAIARNELTAARAALDSAIAADHQAAVDAADDGGTAPKLKAPKAEEQVAAAERQTAALETLHDKRVERYLRTVADAHEELTGNADTEMQRAVPAIEALLDTLAAKLTDLADLQLVRSELGDDADWLLARVVNFRPAREGRLLERDPLDTDVRGLLDQLAAKLTEGEFDRATF